MSANAMLGSSVSLHGAPHAATDIPKEYHRKLLKKIAQLTKVIYVLNTKNDENDDFVQSVRSQHGTEIQKLSNDWTVKLERAQEEWRATKEAGEKKMQDVARELEAVRCEKDDLKASEVKLLQLQEQSSNNIKELDGQLNQLKKEYARRAEEIAEQRRQHAASLKAAQSAHEQEIASVRAALCKEKELLESELESARRRHEAEMKALRQQQESKAQIAENASVVAEGKKWKEKLEAIQRDASEKESSLSYKVSQLSTELRMTKDKLTVSEQKVRDMEASLEKHGSSSAGLQSRLEDAHEHIKSLQSTITSLSTELSATKDKCQQQSAEMHKMSSTIGKLEGIRVSNTGEIQNLKSLISDLNEKLLWLQKERETLTDSQKASEQNQLKIKTLEREVSRLIKEKQELHTQYAHEIEAAHGQINEREHQIELKYMKTLQELKEQHQEALATAMKERANELTALWEEVEMRSEEKMAALVDGHQKETLSLQAALDSKTEELASALSSLEALMKEAEEKNKGLASTSIHVKRLTQQLDESRQDAEAMKKQLAAMKMDNDQLKRTLTELRDDHTSSLNEYKKKVEKDRLELVHKLEEQWSQRLRDECAALRSELAQRHKGDLGCALAKLGALKDQAARDAAVVWNEERNKLEEQIRCLVEKLESVQHTTQQSLENMRNVCDGELATLQRQMDDNMAAHRAEVQRMVESYECEMSATREQYQIQTEELRKKLDDTYRKELQSVQQSNLICIKSLQAEWRQTQTEEISRLWTKHSEDLDNLRNQLQFKHQAELTSEKENCQLQLQKEQQEFGEKWQNAQKEISFCRLTIRNLEAEAERKNAEQATLRTRVSDLTGAINELRKEVEIKGQEILSVRRESNTQIQLQHQQLSATHRAELDSANKHHQLRVQNLLSDFNRAKELLIQKIGELERKHQEAEEKYRRRESRPEDLEEIQKLKTSVAELQSRVKEMAAELRIYQLELSNREKNYNKLFAANPLVGVLDPMAAIKKKAAETGRHLSAPSLMEPSGEESACFSTPPPRRPTKHLDPIEPKTKSHRIVTLKDSPPQPTKILSTQSTHAQPLPVQL